MTDPSTQNETIMDKDRFFGTGREIWQASAPGRLDVMGGIADYSGSLVLEMPIHEATHVHFALRDDGIFRFHSAIATQHDWQPTIEIALPPLLDSNGKPDYNAAQTVLQQQKNARWAGYVLGCALVLMREKQAVLKGGDFFVESKVPPGKGVSASAALEVATMTALTKALQMDMRNTELPELCQKAENLVVGAPCGLMDQLTCYLGKQNHLLPILCQPADLHPPQKLPPDVHFVGIDSGVKHEVSGKQYTKTRTAAFMGYSIIAELEGMSIEDLQQARETGDRSALPYRGYLANILTSDYELNYREHMPKHLPGRLFLQKLQTTIDAITEIDPDEIYAVRACAEHPIYENSDVSLFSRRLEALHEIREIEARRELLVLAGGLMYESHKRYSESGLGHPVTDQLVKQAKDTGPAAGIYGARITGGGCGGTVCLLCDGQKGVDSAVKLADEMARKYGHKPMVFHGSSDGALHRQ